MKTLRLLLTILILCVSAGAQNYPERMPGSGIVADYVGITTPAGQNQFKQKVLDLKQALDIEFGIAIVKREDLGALNAAEYSTELARRWGLGSQEGEHRAFLLLLAYSTIKGQSVVWLQPNRHLEGAFPDGKCAELARIGQDQFVKRDFDGGILAIVNATATQASTILQAPPQTPQSGDHTLLIIGLIVLGLVLIIGAFVFFYSQNKRRKKEDDLLEAAYLRARQEREKNDWVYGNQQTSELRRRNILSAPISPEPPPAVRRREEREQRQETRPIYEPYIAPEPIRRSDPEPERSSFSTWSESSSDTSNESSSSSSSSSPSYEPPSVEPSGGGDFGGAGGGDSF